jgi:nucleoside-diphosphate-sugar epimerase
MKIVITGGAGMLGSKLARSLLEKGVLRDAGDQEQQLTELVLLDVAPPARPIDDPRVRLVTGDLTDPAVVESAIGRDTTGLFHLAAVVSGQAEADFDLGLRVNVDGTRLVLETLRRLPRKARLLFSSSVGIFGPPLPEVIRDDTVPTPQTSYGVQKLIGEWLVADYHRKGLVDGRCVRLPTIVVRPGPPNLAASSFASAVIREPLNGVDYACPVDRDVKAWILSPRRAVDLLIRTFELPSAAIGPLRTLTLPGIEVSVAEMVEALRRVGGDEVANRVTYVPDEQIAAIVGTWATRFEPARATALGFTPDESIDAIIRAYLEDEGLTA